MGYTAVNTKVVVLFHENGHVVVEFVNGPESMFVEVTGQNAVKAFHMRVLLGSIGVGKYLVQGIHPTIPYCPIYTRP